MDLEKLFRAVCEDAAALPMGFALDGRRYRTNTEKRAILRRCFHSKDIHARCYLSSLREESWGKASKPLH